MQSRSSNIIPINENSAQQGFLRDVCDQLNQLTIEYLHPALDSLLSHLIERLEEQLQHTSNNHDIMMTMEVKNALLKEGSKIISMLKEESSGTSFTSTQNEVDTESLILLDNIELDQRLTWITVAEKMTDKENAQPLFQIKNRFKNAFPDFDEPIPATPEKLCESFSKAIDLIHPEEIHKHQLLIWFTQHIKEPADTLWCEVNNLLEEIGLKLNLPSKASGTPPDSYQERTQDIESLSTEFMDSLAEKLVTQVEDMLIRDDLIPESKKYQVKTSDLAGILTGLQLEMLQQRASIFNLTESVQSALNKKGEKSKLSPRHGDLINLVGMLFEYILDDHQLPESIRKSISLLQIPVLRTAILDYDFLTERNHPARVLLNEMTSAGMGCKDDCFSDPVYILIESIVRSIISRSQENPNIFHESLKRFRTELDILNQPDDSSPRAFEEATLTEDVVTEDHHETHSETEEAKYLPCKKSEFNEEEEIILESASPDPVVTNTLNTYFISDHDEEATLSFSEEEEQATEPPKFTQIDQLKVGQWVEFVGEGENHRLNCKLAQIDKDTNRYIFENRSGMKVAECDGIQLLRDIEDGAIIIHSEVQLFDRALQAVFAKFKIR